MIRDARIKISRWPLDGCGYHVAPTGECVKLGYHVSMGDGVTLGDEVELGDGATLGDNVTISDEGRIGAGVRVGSAVFLGPCVGLEDGVTLGSHAVVGGWTRVRGDTKIGNHFTAGHHLDIGEDVTVGDYVTLGNCVTLGDDVVLCNESQLGNNVELGNGVTSSLLAEELREAYRAVSTRGKVRFCKWITSDRMSPRFDGGTPIRYRKGVRVEAYDVVSPDEQGVAGLYVLRIGYRPEWVGLCSAKYAANLTYVDVEVDVDDILFSGLPSADGKVRVRALVPLS